MDEFKSSTTNSTQQQQQQQRQDNNTEIVDKTNQQRITTTNDDNHDSPQPTETATKRPTRRRRLARRRQYAKSRRVASSFLRSQFVRYDILSRKFHDEDVSIGDDWYKVQTIETTDCTTRGDLNDPVGIHPHLNNASLATVAAATFDIGRQQQNPSKSEELDNPISEQDDSSKSSLRIYNRSPINSSSPIITSQRYPHQKYQMIDVYFGNSSSLDSSYSIPTDGNNNITDTLSLSPKQPRTSPLASIPNINSNYMPTSFVSSGGGGDDDVRTIISAHLKQQNKPPQQQQHHQPSRQKLSTNQQHLVRDPSSTTPIERVVRSETIDLNQVGWRPNSPRSKKFFPSTSFNLRDRQQLSQFDLSNVAGPKVANVNRFVSMQRLDDQESSKQRQRRKDETQEVSLFDFNLLLSSFCSK